MNSLRKSRHAILLLLLLLRCRAKKKTPLSGTVHEPTPAQLVQENKRAHPAIPGQHVRITHHTKYYLILARPEEFTGNDGKCDDDGVRVGLWWCVWWMGVAVCGTLNKMAKPRKDKCAFFYFFYRKQNRASRYSVACSHTHTSPQRRRRKKKKKKKKTDHLTEAKPFN